MVWGCFTGELKSTFTTILGGITGEKYRTLMEEQLPQFVEEVYETLGQEPIFMQDNSPVHTGLNKVTFYSAVPQLCQVGSGL